MCGVTASSISYHQSALTYFTLYSVQHLFPLNRFFLTKSLFIYPFHCISLLVLHSLSCFCIYSFFVLLPFIYTSARTQPVFSSLNLNNSTALRFVDTIHSTTDKHNFRTLELAEIDLLLRCAQGICLIRERMNRQEGIYFRSNPYKLESPMVFFESKIHLRYNTELWCWFSKIPSGYLISRQLADIFTSSSYVSSLKQLFQLLCATLHTFDVPWWQ